MKQLFRSIITLTIAGLLLRMFTSCEETSGNPSGHPEGPSEENGGVVNLVTPPKTWKEKWLNHELELERVYFDADVAIYYDAEVPQSITWPHLFMSEVWHYVKGVYGEFGPEGRLYVVCHGGTYSGGRTGNIFDVATSHRSLSDVTATPQQWEEMADWCIDAHVHEVGHVVEGSSHGVHNSPAFQVWKDSKWAEIFQYDVYMGIGRRADAERLYNQYMTQSDDFPNVGTYWFRDWFYPIYDEHGGSKVLNGFFEQLSLHFERTSATSYRNDMNMGEFVHFWSGAAGEDLLDQAKVAFDWTTEMQAQLDQAKIDFPGVMY